MKAPDRTSPIQRTTPATTTSAIRAGGAPTNRMMKGVVDPGDPDRRRVIFVGYLLLLIAVVMTAGLAYVVLFR